MFETNGPEGDISILLDTRWIEVCGNCEYLNIGECYECYIDPQPIEREPSSNKCERFKLRKYIHIPASGEDIHGIWPFLESVNGDIIKTGDESVKAMEQEIIDSYRLFVKKQVDYLEELERAIERTNNET